MASVGVGLTARLELFSDALMFFASKAFGRTLHQWPQLEMAARPKAILRV